MYSKSKVVAGWLWFVICAWGGGTYAAKETWVEWVDGPGNEVSNMRIHHYARHTVPPHTSNNTTCAKRGQGDR
jgi:hypothetical protein